jgi:glutamine synthetase
MLAAGLKGIENDYPIPDPIDENIFEFTDKKARRMRVRTVPGSLLEAVERMERGELAREVLGDHAFEKFVEGKKAEANAYRLHVSEWELGQYLDNY